MPALGLALQLSEASQKFLEGGEFLLKEISSEPGPDGGWTITLHCTEIVDKWKFKRPEREAQTGFTVGPPGSN